MIEIHFEDVDTIDVSEDFISSWFDLVLEHEELALGDVELFFCSDKYLLKINKESLNHDFFTDIITFDYRVDTIISGDLFVSLERVQDNAISLNLPFVDELHRVCVHGLLHICGYGDKTDEEIKTMRLKEDFYLNIRP